MPRTDSWTDMQSPIDRSLFPFVYRRLGATTLACATQKKWSKKTGGRFRHVMCAGYHNPPKDLRHWFLHSILRAITFMCLGDLFKRCLLIFLNLSAVIFSFSAENGEFYATKVGATLDHSPLFLDVMLPTNYIFN